jgi:hypothetical protein
VPVRRHRVSHCANPAAAEKPVEGGVVRQVAGGREFQLHQRNMSFVEIDGMDPGRIGGQIAQHIAAAGRDGNDAALRINFERLEINARVLPDLRVDHRAERERE